MDEESRAKRTAALEEKKKRLEELKRRRQKTAAAAAAAPAVSAASATTGAGASNLDDYIDGLLSNPAPSVPGISTSYSAPQTAAAPVSAATEAPITEAPKTETAKVETTVASTVALVPVVPVKKAVETFTAGTQTEEDDFPPDLVSSDGEEPRDKEDDKEEEPSESVETNDADDATMTTPKVQILSPEEKDKTVSSDPFASFFVNASKKVERLLGAPTLADLLIDADYDAGADESHDMDKKTSTTVTDDSSYGLVSGHATYECSKWTHSRDITCMDWSPTHKELIVTGYHMPGATTSGIVNYFDKSSAAAAVATRTSGSGISSKKVSSTTIVPKPGETQQSDGLALVWSLAMTNRPEHIFTCGSPLLCTKFHPTEPHLLVGGTHCGQLIVWDMRMGRLPVQRSTLSTVANKLKGHSHPICSLEVAEGGVSQIPCFCCSIYCYIGIHIDHFVLTQSFCKFCFPIVGSSIC